MAQKEQIGSFILTDHNDISRNGSDGLGVQSALVEYAKSSSGTVIPSTGWSTSIPSTVTGDFLWSRTTWTYTDSSMTISYSISKMGEKGYTWVKYADSPDEGMSDSSEGKLYIGLAFNKSVPDGSSDYDDYQWSVLPQNFNISEDLDNIYTTIETLKNTVQADFDGVAQTQIDYENRIEANELAILEAKDNLIEFSQRTDGIITDLGELSARWSFIGTNVVMNENGLWIGDEDLIGGTGILIGGADTSRISFRDKGQEIAYISQSMMQILNAIFVESAVIAGFKFEKISGTDGVLGITYVGGQLG